MARYFAYGSNMGTAQMHHRCPDGHALGVGRLEGYRWIITTSGYASILPDDSAHVEGIIWEISATDESALDRFEGVHLGHYRKHTLPVMFEGHEIAALVYIDPVTQTGQALPEYVNRINTALNDAPLDPDYVAQQIRPFIPAATKK